MPKYAQGVAIRCSVEFKDSSTPPVYVDPTTVTFKLRGPLSSRTFVSNDETAPVTTYVYGTDAELVKDAVGRYHVDVTTPTGATVEGIYAFRFEGTGTNASAADGEYTVARSRVYE